MDTTGQELVAGAGERQLALAPGWGVCGGDECGCARRKRTGFTLIELLVVISIIGVLASMVVGLASLATRKGKESRLRAEMIKLVTEIENYKSTFGFYPPDHPGYPSTNQLFYELSGTVYSDQPPPARFTVMGRQDWLKGTDIQTWFNTGGIANAARVEKEVKYSVEFKANQFKRLLSPPVDVLAAPVKGRPIGTPGSWSFRGLNNEEVNPWLYVSSSPTNNPDRFDLWAEVLIGGKMMRFSNWEKDPVVLSR